MKTPDPYRWIRPARTKRTVRALAMGMLSGVLIGTLVTAASVFGWGATTALAASSSSCNAAVAAFAKSSAKSSVSGFDRLAKDCTSLSQLRAAVQKSTPHEPKAETKALASALKKELCLFDRTAKIC